LWVVGVESDLCDVAHDDEHGTLRSEKNLVTDTGP
jgi:hypothetical protein